MTQLLFRIYLFDTFYSEMRKLKGCAIDFKLEQHWKRDLAWWKNAYLTLMVNSPCLTLLMVACGSKLPKHSVTMKGRGSVIVFSGFIFAEPFCMFLRLVCAFYPDGTPVNSFLEISGHAHLKEHRIRVDSYSAVYTYIMAFCFSEAHQN